MVLQNSKNTLITVFYRWHLGGGANSEVGSRRFHGWRAISTFKLKCCDTAAARPVAADQFRSDFMCAEAEDEGDDEDKEGTDEEPNVEPPASNISSQPSDSGSQQSVWQSVCRRPFAAHGG